MLYDSRIGVMDLKVLSLKDELDSKEIDKLIAYMKLLMKKPSDGNTFNADNYQFFFKNFLLQEILKLRMMF